MQADTNSTGRRLLFSRKRILIMLGVLTALMIVQWQWPTLFSYQTGLGDGERVIWLSSTGRVSEDGTHLIAEIDGWVFSGNEDIAGRALTIRYGLRKFKLPPSDDLGHIRATIEVPMLIVGQGPHWRFETVLPESDKRRFPGTVHVLPEKGLSVISSIRDVVQLTVVEPVAGMADLFAKWETEYRARFHFVTALSYRRCPDLQTFAKRMRFPEATFQCMDAIRETTFYEVFCLTEIQALIERFPKRRFALVGQVAGVDAQVYGEIARRFPQQIVHIFLRNTTDESATDPRLREAMRDVPDDRWELFEEPDGLRIRRF